MSSGPDVRRVSHLGGHRFAPTALVFPSGTAWANPDSRSLVDITSRDGEIGTMLDRYRGSLGFAMPRWQAPSARRSATSAGRGWVGGGEPSTSPTVSCGSRRSTCTARSTRGRSVSFRAGRCLSPLAGSRSSRRRGTKSRWPSPQCAGSDLDPIGVTWAAFGPMGDRGATGFRARPSRRTGWRLRPWFRSTRLS